MQLPPVDSNNQCMDWNSIYMYFCFQTLSSRNFRTSPRVTWSRLYDRNAAMQSRAWNWRPSRTTEVNTWHTHNRFTALWIFSGTTRVSRYQKKHLPTDTYRGHQSSLICFLHLLRPMAFSLFNLCLTVFLHNLCASFLLSTSWPGTLHFILHTFLHPVTVFFSQHMPIPSQPVLL